MNRISVKTFITGPIDTNTYILYRGGEGILVDPSSGCGNVLSFIEKEFDSLNGIVLTHGHFDHIMGVPEILKEWPDTTVYISEEDRGYLTDEERNGSVMMGGGFTFKGEVEVINEATQSLGGFPVKSMHIPGHTPGGYAFLFQDNICITGDSLFSGSVGRTDLVGGDGRALLENIKTKLLPLPEETIIYPGHGASTSLKREKRLNPFLS